MTYSFVGDDVSGRTVFEKFHRRVEPVLTLRSREITLTVREADMGEPSIIADAGVYTCSRRAF